jgi:hypothetical protein
MSIRISIPSPNQLSCPQLNQSNGGLTFTQRQTLQAVGPTKSGQSTSYRTGDDGEFKYGRGVSFTGLTCNNPFNNSNRFTDQSGGQTYSDDIVVDWLTGLMWYRIPNAVDTWNNAIDGCLAYTGGSFTDWFLANINQHMTIMSWSATAIGLNYAPFSISASESYWTSTTAPTSSVNAVRIVNNTAIPGANTKTATNKYLYCRYFALSDMGL